MYTNMKVLCGIPYSVKWWQEKTLANSKQFSIVVPIQVYTSKKLQ